MRSRCTRAPQWRWPTATPRRPAAPRSSTCTAPAGWATRWAQSSTRFTTAPRWSSPRGNQDRRHLALEPYLFARSTALMEPYVKFSHEPARPQDVPAAIDRAWALARTPPQGPAFVSIPSGDWDAPALADGDAEGASPERDVLFGVGADEDLLDRLAERIEAAGAPALIVGGGVDQARAWDEVAELAERLSGPVWTAPQAPRLGFAEDHPLYQGHLAPGRATAAAQLAGCDLALVLGAPVFAFLPYEPRRASGPGRFPQIIHVTDDPGEAARAPALSVVAEVGSVARGLSERLRPRSPAPAVASRPAPAPVDAPAGGSDPAGVPDGGARASAARGRRAGRGVAVEPQRPARAGVDPPAGELLCHRERRPGLRHAGRGRDQAGLAGAPGGLPGRRRLGAVRAPGAVERGAARRRGHLRRRQQRPLRDPRGGRALRRPSRACRAWSCPG